MDETNQLLALELWGRKWNLVIRGVKSSVKDERFESPRGTLHLVQAFLIETLGYKQEEIDNIQFAVVVFEIHFRRTRHGLQLPLSFPLPLSIRFAEN
jgi:hypothetical protein